MGPIEFCGVMAFVMSLLLEILNSLAGSGKTILAYHVVNSTLTYIYRSVIVNHLEQTFNDNKDVGVAYIYCNYKEELSTESLLRGLLKQQARQRPGLSNDIYALYKKHHEDQSAPGFHECSTILSKELHSFTKVYLVIDALDECTEDIRWCFASQLSVQPSNLHLLITSRPHITDVYKIFGDTSQLEIRPTQEDITIYLDGCIEQETRLKRNVQKDPTLKRTIIDVILSKVDGM